MRWTAKDAQAQTAKANTPSKQKRWAKVANLAFDEKNDEAYAILTANAAMDSRFWDGIVFQNGQFKVYCKSLDHKINDDPADGDGGDDDGTNDDDFDNDDDFNDPDDPEDNLDDMNQCPDCDGNGMDADGNICPTCNGNGMQGDDDDDDGGNQPHDTQDPYDTDTYDSAYKKPWTHATCDRDWTAAQRAAAAKSGAAMPGGGFPIQTKADLTKAMQALGRAKNRNAAIAHIKTRAKALGVTLPTDWPNNKTSDNRSPAIAGVSLDTPFATDSVTTIRMYDTITLDDASKVRDMEGGYLSAMPRIARTGIQLYHGMECGRDDMSEVRVYRPEDSVFANDAVHSYTHLPVTLDHPPEMVTASNWKQYAVGETGDEVLRDGGSVRVPMMLRDAKAISLFRKGKNQLSVGYDCDLQWSPGVTDSGEEYDAIQHGIRANHLAVVAAARGGPTLKIGDASKTTVPNQGEYTMNLRTVLVDGLEVQVADTAAPVIQRSQSNFQTMLQDAREKLKARDEEAEERDAAIAKKDAAIKVKDADIKARDKTIEAKDGEIAVLKKQLEDEKAKSSPAAIDAASRERADVVVKAQKLLGGSLKVDGMSVPEIRRAVVDARIGNCKDWSDDRVGGAFDAMQSNDRLMQPSHRNDINDAVTVFGRPGSGYMSPQQIRDAAYNDYDKERSEAWRNAPKQ